MRASGRLGSALLALVVAGPALAYGLDETQEMAPPGKERKSRPGELQKGALPAPPTKLPAMDPKRPLPPAPIGGRIERMEEHLTKPATLPAGERQPDVDLSQAARPAKGYGEQKPKEAIARPEGQHLRLVLRITEVGGAEVVGAAELPGPALFSELGTGDFVYELVSDGKTVVAQAIPDPFEMRSFAGPEGSPIEGHHSERAKTATLTISVPDMTLASSSLERLSVRFYKLQPGAPVSKIDASGIQKLREENRLELRSEIPAAKLAGQIRERARKPKLE